MISEGSFYTCVPQDLFERTIDLAPVNDRAWVMQERLLSRREIVFSQHQIFWECRSRKTCEMFPDQIPKDPSDIVPCTLGYFNEKYEAFLFSVIDTTVLQQQANRSCSLTSQADKTRLLRVWRELLKRYVSCGITYTSDRLIAINGITKYFEQALDDKCVFGLWRSQPPFQLIFLYLSNKDSQEDYAEGNQQVPSWSWARHEQKLQLAPEINDPEEDQRTWDKG